MTSSSEEAAGAPHVTHVVPGHHYYEDIPYCGLFPKESLDRAKQFEFRDDDIVLAVYPKSGTYWMGHILYLLKHDGKPEADFNTIISEHIPIFEMSFPIETGAPSSMDMLAKKTTPRMMKTHLEEKFFRRPLNSSKTKFIILQRNIKDVLVSYYHFFRSNGALGKFQGTFPEWMELYKAGKTQDWFDWNLGWWKHKDHPNVCFFKYEDMAKDLGAEVRRLAGFLGIPYTEETIARVCQQASFDNMSKEVMGSEIMTRVIDHDVSPFMRKGKTGTWKCEFTKELETYIDELYEARMKNTDLKFDFE